MLKKKIIKKLGIIFACLVVIQIVILFPKNNEEFTIKTNATTGVIYLLDNNQYVSRLEIIYNATSTEKLISEMIDILTINNAKSIKIRDGFSPIIPESTKLLSCSVEESQANLNFSKEFLTINKDLEERMIEAIVYTVTSLKKIDRVKIMIEDKILEKLPHSQKQLPIIIDRSIGINKKYDITTLANIKETTIYYLAKNNDYIYYVPVTKYSNENKEKIEIIIDELKSSSVYNTNLISYLNDETKLISYEMLDRTFLLNFNDAILADINSTNIIEEVAYSINMSINETYNLDNVIYYVEDNIIDNYFLARG